jgi:hypothetical protein
VLLDASCAYFHGTGTHECNEERNIKHYWLSIVVNTGTLSSDSYRCKQSIELPNNLNDKSR